MLARPQELIFRVKQLKILLRADLLQEMRLQEVERALEDKILAGDRSLYFNEDNTTKDEFIMSRLKIVKKLCVSR